MSKKVAKKVSKKPVIKDVLVEKQKVVLVTLATVARKISDLMVVVTVAPNLDPHIQPAMKEIQNDFAKLHNIRGDK